jgi:hypothetical protein
LANTLKDTDGGWKERINGYVSIRGLFLAVIVGGTMVATIIAVAYAVSNGQVSDRMTGKMTNPATHSNSELLVTNQVISGQQAPGEKEVMDVTGYIDALLANEGIADTQPAPTQPAPTQPAPEEQPAPTQPRTAPGDEAASEPADTPGTGQNEETIAKEILGTAIKTTNTDASLIGTIP